jgi:leucyl/phenylalanyl-tRNA--protein transferase
MTLSDEGHQLDSSTLLMAYRQGYFPMAESRTGAISWYSPDRRAIIPLDTFKPSRSLMQTMRKKIFTVRMNTVFAEVMRFCAERDETWISDEIVKAYTELHAKAFAHSVESWHEGRLVGGLYGVAIGGAFFGESMFSRMTNASKVAMVCLVNHLRRRRFTLLDTQFMNPHVKQFGACEVPRSTYLALLKHAVLVKTTFLD